MIIPVLTSKNMISALVEVHFYLEKAIENLKDVDVKIQCNQILTVAEDVLSDFLRFYEERRSTPPKSYWEQISKSWSKASEKKAELALSLAFSSARLVDTGKAEKCLYPHELRAKAKELGDRILHLLHEIRGLG
jgi:hypothetical protein